MLLWPSMHIGSMAATLRRSNAVLLTLCENNDRQKFSEILKELDLCIIAESSLKSANTLVAVSSKLAQVRSRDCRVIKVVR